MYLYPDEQGVIGEGEMRAKIGPRTKIVSAIHVSNVLGVANDVKLMGRIAHEFGAIMIVDGAQSVPHFPVDVCDLGCDFFAFSGHKVFGPFGIGVLWGRRELLEAMSPFLTGGEMIDSVTEQGATWRPFPRSSRPAPRTPPASTRSTRRSRTWTRSASMPCRHAIRRSSPSA